MSRNGLGHGGRGDHQHRKRGSVDGRPRERDPRHAEPRAQSVLAGPAVGQRAGPRRSKKPSATTCPAASAYNINGGRSAGTHVLLDGASNNFEFDTTVGQHVPLDSVQEFSVVTNNFSAQYGRVDRRRRQPGHEVRLEHVHRHRLRVLSHGKDGDQLTGQHRQRRAEGPVHPQPARLQRGRPDREEQGALLLELRSASTSTAPTRCFPGSRRRNCLRPVRRRPRAYFTAYDKGAVINGPLLTRGQVSGHPRRGHRRGRVQPAARPACRCSAAWTKCCRLTRAAGLPRRTTSSSAKVDWNMGTATQAYVRLRVREPDTDAGTNSSSPYPGFDTGQHNRNHHLLGLGHARLLADDDESDQGGLQPGQQPAADQRRSADAAADDESERSRFRCRATTSRSPDICRGVRPTTSPRADRRTRFSSITT